MEQSPYSYMNFISAGVYKIWRNKCKNNSEGNQKGITKDNIFAEVIIDKLFDTGTKGPNNAERISKEIAVKIYKGFTLVKFE